MQGLSGCALASLSPAMQPLQVQGEEIGKPDADALMEDELLVHAMMQEVRHVWYS